MSKKIVVWLFWVVVNAVILIVSDGNYKEFFPIIKSDFSIDELLKDYDFSEFVTFIILPVLTNLLFQKKVKL